MDWTPFLEDNGQSIFTLAGVFLGSLITLLVSFLNNRFQAKERDNDRKESRRETKIQLALELKRNDIETIENVIDNSLRSMIIYSNIRIKKVLGKVSE